MQMMCKEKQVEKYQSHFVLIITITLFSSPKKETVFGSEEGRKIIFFYFFFPPRWVVK